MDVARRPAVRRRPTPRHPGGSDLARLAAGLTRHAGATGAVAPHRPWLSPLPDELAPAALEELTPGRHRAPTRLRLGLLDLPDRQTQEALEVDLAEGGGWLAVGGPRSGRTTLLRSILAEAVSRLGPADLHVHVIERGGGGLADEAPACRTPARASAAPTRSGPPGSSTGWRRRWPRVAPRVRTPPLP